MKGRLYDKLQAELSQAASRDPDFFKSDSGREWELAWDMLRGAVVIDANDVADHFVVQERRKRIYNLHDDFPNVAPPFPTMFFEFRHVSLTPDINSPRSHGVAASYRKSGDASGWQLSLRWFYENKERQLQMCPWELLAQVSPEGVIVGKPYAVTKALALPEKVGIWGAAPIALRAICFMHCRNAVEIVDNTPNPEKSEAHRRRYGLPLCSHKTLVVRPVRQVRAAREAAQARGEPLDLRLHQVRGHFKRYTKDAPLLGRHVGTYFWPDYLRGNPDLGVIEKDYKVEP